MILYKYGHNPMARKLPNWIQAYLAFTNQSESPEEYHKWVAISCIAAVLRRKVFFDMGYFIVYPNMYIVLVGPAGRCKKSTAMRIGRERLNDVPGISFTTDSITRERLIQDLSQVYVDGHSSMTAFSSEFASLLTSSGMDMVVFLTDIFDSPNEWSHKTKMGGTNKIKAPYLNLMAATTPDWIAKAMPLDTVGIGLTSRIVFVYHDTPRIRPPFPSLSEDEKILRGLLVHDLAQISQISGEYKLTNSANKKYTEWYESRIQATNPTGDPRLSGYYERKHIHLLKVCMIVAASYGDSTIITEEYLSLALQLFDEVEERMPRVFANVGKNPLAVDYDLVGDLIKQTGSANFGELLDKFKHSLRKDEMAEVLETLMSTGKIIGGPGQTYRPSKGKK